MTTWPKMPRCNYRPIIKTDVSDVSDARVYGSKEVIYRVDLNKVQMSKRPSLIVYRMAGEEIISMAGAIPGGSRSASGAFLDLAPVLGRISPS